jgi:riboflavin kinase / FMN adenylyltransferase
MKRVIAIGNFDGVHAGHKAIFEAACRMAEKLNATPAALTFEPNPRAYFSPDAPPFCLMSLDEKTDAIAACGIQEIILAQFDATLAALPAERFAKDVLENRLQAAHVITGENFIFGNKRGGNAALLKQWLSEVGVGYTAVGAVKDADGTLSSSRIRDALAQGDVAKAARLLGRPYTISGIVTHGDKRGRTIGFPTLNLPLKDRLAPKFGVYAVIIKANNNTYAGVANIGVKPTFGGTSCILEAHAFAKLPSLYGSPIRVALHHFIRPERRFENPKSLIDQIGKDVLEAKRLLGV